METLQPLAEFYMGDFSTQGIKEKINNLTTQHTCQAFVTICSADNRIRIVHSLGTYVAPIGYEDEDNNHDYFFAFKGHRTKQCNPPIVHFKSYMLTLVKYKVRTEEEVVENFNSTNNPTPIFLLDESEDEAEISQGGPLVTTMGCWDNWSPPLQFLWSYHSQM